MAGFSEKKEELDALGITVVASSVDSLEHAQKMAETVNFPIGYGVSRDIAHTLDSWWDERRNFIQPSEFVLGPDNRVIACSYSDGPVGRMVAKDVLAFVAFVDSRK